MFFPLLIKLKNSYNFKVYICRHLIIFSCDNDKYGKLKCNFSHSYSHFEFGILKSGERYDINNSFLPSFPFDFSHNSTLLLDVILTGMTNL